jgi:hypothetical protein
MDVVDRQFMTYIEICVKCILCKDPFIISLRLHKFHHFLNIFKNFVIVVSEMREGPVIWLSAVPIRNGYPFY